MSSSLSLKHPLVLHSTSSDTKNKFPLDIKIFGPGTDKRAIYDLRYRAFIEAALITPRDDKSFSDEYDELSTTTTLAAFHRDACIGSFRLTFGHGEADNITMPCQTIFPEVAALKAHGYNALVEFTRLAIAPELTNTSFRATLYGTLVRAGFLVADAGGADYGLISINPSQVKFYEMMCGFKETARAHNYPGITVTAPAVLLGRSFKALDARRTTRNPFFRIAPHEVANARALLFPHTEEAGSAVA